MSNFVKSFLGSFLLLSILCCRTLTQDERALELREDDTSGISVGAPKVYDDAVLQQLLVAAQARLAAIQVIDQTGIATRLGGLSGASQQFSSLTFNVLGPPTPAITTTATSPNAETTNDGTTTTTTSTAASEQTVTNVPQVDASIPGTTSPAITLPTTGFGVSASDLLNEQVQLTFEIANLRLLLEGSLSDQMFVTKSWDTFVKPRATIGFPISITPGRRFRHAVAIVEAEVYSKKPAEDLSGRKEPAALVSILPREKTYNVAAITERSSSIGAGVVTQVASIGGSFLSGRRTFYIVRDQDTVATTFRPAAGEARLGFGWQFRPVLGQNAVQSGLRQTFVQLSFPTTQGTPTFGQVHLRTYWRGYDPRSGALKGIIPGSLKEYEEDIPIPRFDMRQDLDDFVVSTDAEDLGNGTMLVSLAGAHLNGTYVRAGTTILQQGSGLISDANRIRFVAQLADLAKGAKVVTRDGTETPIVEDFDGISKAKPVIVSSNVTVLDEINSRLVITTAKPAIDDLPPLVVVIGGKVFGYSDAPIEREFDQNTDQVTLKVVAPTTFLAANREATVKPLFVDRRYQASVSLVNAEAQPERLVLIRQQENTLDYLLYGSRFGKYRDADDIKVIAPKNKKLELVGSGVEQDRVRLLRLSTDEAKQFKQVIVQRPDQRPFGIAIPPLVEEPKPKPEPKAAPKFAERITVGADEAVIVGDGLKDVVKVKALGIELTDLVMDGKKLRVKGLAAAITVTARTVDCTLLTKTDTLATIPLEIVSSKVESIPK